MAALGCGGETATRYVVKNILSPLSLVDMRTRLATISEPTSKGWPAFGDFAMSGPNVNLFWAMFHPEMAKATRYVRNTLYEELTATLAKDLNVLFPLTLTCTICGKKMTITCEESSTVQVQQNVCMLYHVLQFVFAGNTGHIPRQDPNKP